MKGLKVEEYALMELMYIVIGTLLILTATTLYQIRKNHNHAPTKKSVAVLVLGDVGRSPRIMYHAQSFIDNGYSVSLIGYAGIYSSKIRLPPPI
jgi:beta-1,4-mannosyltransferase